METITKGIKHNMHNWYGSIAERFSAIDNLVGIITAHQPAWTIPAPLLEELTANHSRIQAMISHCRTNQASRADRLFRTSLLKSTVNLCRTRIRAWAQEGYFNGMLTAEDVHLLGFLLPGEHGGRHARANAASAMAEVKVRTINADFIRVTIDHATGESAARIAHGWPPGMKKAVIVIIAENGKTEVLRILTTCLHNTLQLPKGSHGKQFIIKASFIKHLNDDPLFGAEQTFSMPLTTEDIVTSLPH
ncbi:MAG: hypothetical protein LBN98_03175 [Prevotellaceae bacterium]|jgi:hypothetical protein|nr:hypothetical protein [Prevotellaceae bacterium]